MLAVRDFGPGIEPDEQERIFERFYRARAVRLKPIRGSGIGLALVQHIARAHGGDVDGRRATPGKGATFQHLAADRWSSMSMTRRVTEATPSGRRSASS